MNLKQTFIFSVIISFVVCVVYSFTIRLSIFNGKDKKQPAGDQEPSYRMTQIKTSKGRVHTFIIFTMNGQTIIVQDPDSDPTGSTSDDLSMPEEEGKLTPSKL